MTVFKYSFFAVCGVFALSLIYLTLRPLQVTTTPVTITVDEARIVRKN
ncbi:MAG: hypothetical protein QM523_09650 [Candidatus Pacebacteria bacterium]|nr:hypothetical protein [Candidatus Paceibacterota bacterium]